MEYKSEEIIDIKKISHLLESYTKATGLVSALLDLDGNILSQSGWQKICTKFHRIHPETAKNCCTSDTVLTKQLQDGSKYNIYTCLNGLVDVAVPIIINGKHLYNLFTGQFFTETPNEKFFIAQAKKYNFDKKEYMDAFRQVPIIKESEIKDKLLFLSQMTEMIVDLSLAKLERIKTNIALKESEEKYRLIDNASIDYIYSYDLDGKFNHVNPSLVKFFDLPLEQILGKTHRDLNYPEDVCKEWDKLHQRVYELNTTVLSETISPNRNGELRYYEIILNPLHNAENNIIGIAGTTRDITERKQTEEKLKESKEKFKALYNNAPLSYQSLNEDGSFNDVNPTWLSTLGYERNEIIGHYFKDFLHPDMHTLYESRFPKFKECGYLNAAQFKIKHKDGHYLDISFEGRIGYNPDGSFKQTYCVFTDITERKKAKEKLFESIEQLNLALEGANAGLWSWNIKTGEDIFDERWCAILGYTKKEIKQDVSSWKELMHPDDKKRVWNVINKHFENEKNEFKEEYRMKCKNGEWKWIFAVGKVVKRDNNDEPVQMTGIIIDIAEQKHTEEKIRIAEKNLQNTFDISPSIICKANIDTGFFVEANQAVKRILGYSVKEFTSKPIIDFIHPEDKQATAKIILEQKKEKAVTFFENRYLCADGSYKWLSWQSTTADENRIITSVASNINEQKLAENEVRKYQENLEELVKERTKKLEEKNIELERFNDLFVDREFRIKELKDEISELKNK